MRPRFLRAVAVIVGLSLFAGCAPWHAFSRKVGTPDLTQVRSFYVVHNKDDTGGLDKVIQQAFQQMGFEAAIGDAGRIPGDPDAIVTYEFQWFWDLSTYLLMLKVIVREPDTQWPIAMGESVRPSLARKSPDKMAFEILAPIFNPSALPADPTKN
ncbi:MAG: hypothetical protein P8X96_04755 [Desulfobacteraceae bacterium]|jgi:hypothetical protein